MNQPQSLAAYFTGWAALRPARVAVAAIVTALSAAAIEMAELVGKARWPARSAGGPARRATSTSKRRSISSPTIASSMC